MVGESFHAQPLGASTLNVSVSPYCEANALTGLTVKVEQSAVASEILVINAALRLPEGSAEDVTGKPWPEV